MDIGYKDEVASGMTPNYLKGTDWQGHQLVLLCLSEGVGVVSGIKDLEMVMIDIHTKKTRPFFEILF